MMLWGECGPDNAGSVRFPMIASDLADSGLSILLLHQLSDGLNSRNPCVEMCLVI